MTGVKGGPDGLRTQMLRHMQGMKDEEDEEEEAEEDQEEPADPSDAYWARDKKKDAAAMDCPRLDGNLAVSRGLADFQYKQVGGSGQVFSQSRVKADLSEQCEQEVTYRGLLGTENSGIVREYIRACSRRFWCPHDFLSVPGRGRKRSEAVAEGSESLLRSRTVPDARIGEGGSGRVFQHRPEMIKNITLTTSSCRPDEHS